MFKLFITILSEYVFPGGEGVHMVPHLWSTTVEVRVQPAGVSSLLPPWWKEIRKGGKHLLLA